jgi:hypothetical protein
LPFGAKQQRNVLAQELQGVLSSEALVKNSRPAVEHHQIRRGHIGKKPPTKRGPDDTLVTVRSMD